jgi:hypothetical protein
MPNNVSLLVIEECLDSIARKDVKPSEIKRILDMIREWKQLEPIPRKCPSCVERANSEQFRRAAELDGRGRPRKPEPVREPAPVTVTFKSPA